MDKQKVALQLEFERTTRKTGRRYLALRDLLNFSHSLPVQDLCHLGVLWVLDRSHTGRITLDDLYALAETCLQRSKLYQSFERETHLQVFCTMALWASVCGRPHAFVDWMTALILEGGPQVKQFRQYGPQQFLSMGTLQMLHRALRVQQQHGMDLQQFVDLLQRAGEERRLMDLQDEAQDDWVPLAVIQDFLLGLHTGAARLMADIMGGDLAMDAP